MKTITTKYTANGLAKVKISDEVSKLIRFNSIPCPDEITLINIITKAMIASNTKGVVIEVIKETKVEDEDEIFFNKDYTFDSIGELTDEEYFFLQDQLLNKTNQI